MQLEHLLFFIVIVVEFLYVSPGVLERHYSTHIFDVFQQYDREVGKIMADKLNLTYAIYQGGIIKTTRPFCLVKEQ